MTCSAFRCALLPLLVTHASVVSVFFASRHGTRAPNPVVNQICPGLNEMVQQFQDVGVAPAGVTGNGLREMYSVGVFARERYVKEAGLISRKWDPREIKFYGAAEPRTLQSGIAMGQGMFSGPKGFDLEPEPVPVFLNATKGFDNLGEARKADCNLRLIDDSLHWDITEGAEMWKQERGTMDALSELCKQDLKLSPEYTNGLENMGDAVKDVSDAMMFALREGFTTPFNETFFADVRSLALRMLYGRLLSTKEQWTYMSGQFPQAMINHFNAAKDKLPGRLRIVGYHGHRELLYALSMFFRVPFNYNHPGFNPHGIPSATTMFFELHNFNQTEANQESVQPGLYVRLVIYMPCEKVVETLSGSPDIFCQGQATRFRFYPHSDYVPFGKFKEFILDQIHATGSYRDLCAAAPRAPVIHPPLAAASNSGSMFSAVFYVAIGAALSALWFLVLGPWTKRR